MAVCADPSLRCVLVRCMKWIDRRNKLGRRCTKPYGHKGRHYSRLKKL